jgi:hypothetical protein
MKRYEPFIGDVETYGNFFCCTLLSLESNRAKLFVIDDKRNDAHELIQAFRDIYFIGYNNKSYDNLVINYIISNPDVKAEQIFDFSDRLIKGLRRDDHRDFYLRFGQYMNNSDYKYIDLMRMLFSKKLRVSLKELECSLNFKNVEDLPYPVGAILTEEQKRKVIEYNLNDCEATKLVAEKSLPDLKLRVWTQKNFGVEGYSLDGVNLGVKILEKKLAERIGNSDFTKSNTNRKTITIKDIIYPFIKFDTPEFNQVLKNFQDLKVYKYLDKKDGKEKWSKYKSEVLIGPYLYKYGLGGLHFETATRAWHCNDDYTVLSIDVSSYYPAQLIEYPGYCKPEHLPDEFVEVYRDVRDERLRAKTAGDKTKSETYKLSINGAFGNLSNEFSWLYDPKALLAITVNGQLMLSMLCEKLMQQKIKLVDVNTDGVYVYLHKDQRESFDKICKWWEKATKMALEETRFESIYFLTTADYFGTTLNKGKIELKEKGCFITTPRLGKGMEFPIIYKAVKEYFLNKKDFTKYIRECDNILDFCSYKKLKKDYTCFWKGDKQQKVNRFYASRDGAHLYKRKWNEDKRKFEISHILKDSPVMLLNRLDDKSINERSINYPFYLSTARGIIVSLEGDKGQQELTLF